ncbi:MAG: hypothetical protein K2W94_01035 [Alphaproteobacteria bacterium]|nr:hypothetical protein [Alphaproteobacteria bacterium]
MASAPSSAHKGIKIGFEIEMTGPFKYKPEGDGKGLRHKKLLNIKNSGGQLIWHVEVDSSNKDIEIVSVPFAIPDQNPEFEMVIHSVGAFFNFLPTLFLAGSSSDAASFDEAALARLNVGLAASGFNAELVSGNFLVEKRNDLGLWVLPQLTFQIPLESIGSFYNYLAEKEDFFDAEERELFKNFDSSKDKITGLYNLMSFYIENLRYKAPQSNHLLIKKMLAKAKSAEFEDVRKIIGDLEVNASPFHHLQTVMGSHARLEELSPLQRSFIQIQKGADSLRKKETGIKQLFPVMSRLSFSDMFMWVGLLPTEADAALREKFATHSYDVSEPVLVADYPIMKNPLYKKGDDLSQVDVVYPYPYLSTDIFGRGAGSPVNITLENWLQSIINPTEAGVRPLSHPEKITHKAIKTGLKERMAGLGGELTIGNMREYLHGIFSPRSNGKDLMSPAPFSKDDDSMGALNTSAPGFDLRYGAAVLEVRRYGNFFNVQNTKHFKGDFGKVITGLSDLILVEKNNVLGYLFRK